MNFSIPYGASSLKASIPDSRIRAVVKAAYPQPDADGAELVRRAVGNPIASPSLRRLAEGKKNVVLIASDHTRPVPSKIIVPAMLKEIREGNPDADITMLIATGCHRGTTRDELMSKFGSEIMNNEKIVVHDCDLSPMASLGTLPSGGELVLNKTAAEADLLVAEGFIEPHFFAGFSGGRKSVMPGVAARTTVLYNHNAGFIDSPDARAGILDTNPIHADTLYAAKAAKLAFIVNVALDIDKNIIHAVAGHFNEAHRAGCDYLSSICRVKAPEADIVITSNGGYPLDQNIYQAVKGMTAAESAVKPGGVIIMAAKCDDGHGGENFWGMFNNGDDIEKILAGLRETPCYDTKPDQWQSQILIRVLKHAHVIFISDAPDKMVRALRMIPSRSIEDALAKADKILGTQNAGITVIPDGVSVIVSKG